MPRRLRVKAAVVVEEDLEAMKSEEGVPVPHRVREMCRSFRWSEEMLPAQQSL